MLKGTASFTLLVLLNVSVYFLFLYIQMCRSSVYHPKCKVSWWTNYILEMRWVTETLHFSTLALTPETNCRPHCVQPRSGWIQQICTELQAVLCLDKVSRETPLEQLQLLLGHHKLSL